VKKVFLFTILLVEKTNHASVIISHLENVLTVLIYLYRKILYCCLYILASGSSYLV